MVAVACTKPTPPADPSSSSTGGFGTIRIAPGAPIELGTLLSTSGDASTQGVETLGGITLAVDYLDGKLDGRAGTLFADHPIQPVNVDEGCTADGGRAGARILAAEAQVVSVIGTSCSVAAVDEADRILSGHGVTLISPSNIAPALTAAATHRPFYLRIAPNGALEASVAADLAYDKLGVRTATVITGVDPSVNAPGATFVQRFQKQGGQVTSTAPVATRKDLKKAVDRMTSDPPGVVFYQRSDPGPQCGQLARDLAANPALSGTALIVSGACMDASYLDAAGPAATGTYLVGPDPTVFEDFYTRQILPAYTREFDATPTTPFPAYGYDAASIVFDALQRSAKVNDDGSLTIGRSALRDALFATSEYLGLTGTITCGDTGDCAADVNMGVFRVPEVPLPGGDPQAQPVFTESISPSDLLP